MSQQNGTPRRRFALVGVAALAAGVLAGAVGIYVMGAPSGNQALAGNCPARDGLRQALLDGAKGEVAAVNPLDTPFDASTLAFRTAEDVPVTLAAFAGRTLLVNLWATWCVPCRAEMPALDALEASQGGPDFAVIPINVDLGSVETPKAFYADTGIQKLPFYRDDTMAVFNDLKSQGVTIGLPVSLIVDPKGCARGVLTGPAEWASPDAVGLIQAVKKASL
jgi:thiol-disulfide isomerase/thioredoxin